MIGAGRKERKGINAQLQKESAEFVSGTPTSESSATINKRGGRSPHVAVYQVPRTGASARARVFLSVPLAVHISKDQPRVSRSANLSCRLMDAGLAD